MKREESENRGTPRTTDTGTAEAAWAADLALLRRAQGGDAEAVETLAQRMLCIPRILDVLARRSGPFRDAEERLETIQEVASRVWSALDRFQGRAGLETWIYGFCALTLVDLRRARRRRERRESPLASTADVPDAATEGLTSLDAIALQAAVTRLPDEEAAVVEGRIFDDLTFEEFAARAGLSPNTAKTRYYRAIDRLRRWLRLAFGESESGDAPERLP